MYIPKPNCQKTWCNFKSETCYSFPVRHHDFCFMSTSYFDICDFDNSAALFCPSFQNSIFGFAKKSSQCGANGIPSVYTSVSTLVRMYNLIYGYPDHKYLPTDRPTIEDYDFGLDLGSGVTAEAPFINDVVKPAYAPS